MPTKFSKNWLTLWVPKNVLQDLVGTWGNYLLYMLRAKDFSYWPQCISQSCIKIKIKLTLIFIFTLLCEAFIKPFHAPHGSVKIEIKVNFFSSSCKRRERVKCNLLDSIVYISQSIHMIQRKWVNLSWFHEPAVLAFCLY